MMNRKKQNAATKAFLVVLASFASILYAIEKIRWYISLGPSVFFLSIFDCFYC